MLAAELDRVTGLVADESTPAAQRYTEFFVPGTEPEPLRSVPWKLPVFGALVAY
jgi:hypothetical protein